MDEGIIEAKDLYSSQSLSVIVAGTTGAIQDAHMEWWLEDVYKKDSKSVYEPWSCGGMEFKFMWEKIQSNLLLYVGKLLEKFMDLKTHEEKKSLQCI